MLEALFFSVACFVFSVGDGVTTVAACLWHVSHPF